MRRRTLIALFFALNAFALEPFPRTPDAALTPGSLCRDPEKQRYPERIDVCRRSVSSAMKDNIVRIYDDRGYQVGRMGRQRFKIDHYIPLCMGGSNELDNLWPQHGTVFELTDPLEEATCGKMAAGRLKQAKAIEYIRRGKADPEIAPRLVLEVDRL